MFAMALTKDDMTYLEKICNRLLRFDTIACSVMMIPTCTYIFTTPSDASPEPAVLRGFYVLALLLVNGNYHVFLSRVILFNKLLELSLSRVTESLLWDELKGQVSL